MSGASGGVADAYCCRTAYRQSGCRDDVMTTMGTGQGKNQDIVAENCPRRNFALDQNLDADNFRTRKDADRTPNDQDKPRMLSSISGQAQEM